MLILSVVAFAPAVDAQNEYDNTAEDDQNQDNQKAQSARQRQLAGEHATGAGGDTRNGAATCLVAVIQTVVDTIAVERARDAQLVVASRVVGRTIPGMDVEHCGDHQPKSVAQVGLRVGREAHREEGSSGFHDRSAGQTVAAGEVFDAGLAIVEVAVEHLEVVVAAEFELLESDYEMLLG